MSELRSPQEQACRHDWQWMIPENSYRVALWNSRFMGCLQACLRCGHVRWQADKTQDIDLANHGDSYGL